MYLENWEELRAILRNTYTENRTLDFHATQLFGAKQDNSRNKTWTKGQYKLHKIKSEEVMK